MPLISRETSEPKRKFPRNYCCDTMKSHLNRTCLQHSFIDCADNVIVYCGRKTYGILIHDGGSSYYQIKYCPWCGKEFK